MVIQERIRHESIVKKERKKKYRGFEKVVNFKLEVDSKQIAPKGEKGAI